MKKVLSISVFTLIILTVCAQGITDQERKRALSHLKQTNGELANLVKGLSDEQVNYKPGEDQWSIAECLEHIAISEQNLMGMIQNSLQADPNPSKRSEVAMGDDQLLGLITSREQKVKTRKEFEPTNSFGGFTGTLKTFKQRRKSTMKFVKSTDLNLRNYYMQFPFGLIDSYQGVLFLSGHTKRHTDQIKEIMQSESYPQ
ncbi:DinB family protein [Ekhidna sp. MALMAid0563]|uniref:DinB family protein n=1 Tax=Ekhidna sp. MALMAid0563 TaxID=3143937 RepID=UPI0032DE3C70